MDVQHVAVVSYVSVVDSEDREIRYPVGKYMSRSDALNALVSGNITQVVFRKKDSTITSRNVIAKAADQKCGSRYICAKDIHKIRLGLPAYINIKISGIIGVVTKGSMHIIRETVEEEEAHGM